MFLDQPDFLIGNFILAEEVVFEGEEGVLLNSVSYSLHQPDDEAQVVDGGQPVGQQLLALEQVVKVGGRESAAGIAVTASINRPVLRLVRSLSYVLSSLHGKESAVASYSSGQGAVKEVYSFTDALDDVLR